MAIHLTGIIISINQMWKLICSEYYKCKSEVENHLFRFSPFLETQQLTQLPFLSICLSNSSLEEHLSTDSRYNFGDELVLLFAFMHPAVKFSKHLKIT